MNEIDKIKCNYGIFKSAIEDGFAYLKEMALVLLDSTEKDHLSLIERVKELEEEVKYRKWQVDIARLEGDIEHNKLNNIKEIVTKEKEGYIYTFKDIEEEINK